MKRLAIFAARFALVPMISGPFVVSANGLGSLYDRAHVVAGIAMLYVILWLVIVSVQRRELRVPALLALGAGLTEAIPGVPRVHAAVSPVLFAALTWAAAARPGSGRRRRRAWLLPVLLLIPISYGVGYRHQTGEIVPHIAAAMAVAGTLLIYGFVLSQRANETEAVRAAAKLAMAAVVFQIVFGVAAFMIRLLEIEGGLGLAIARAAHITGAAPVLAASVILALRVGETGPDLLVDFGLGPEVLRAAGE